MGYGDEIMATGMARGAAARGKRAAFGDANRIIWGPWSEEIFRHNPNIARPGSEGADDLEWIAHYKGHRLYNERVGPVWRWNYSFRPVPGEIYFDQVERDFAAGIEPGFILIEPNIPQHKSVAVNKQWPVDRYQKVADALCGAGHRVVQLKYGGRHKLLRIDYIRTANFRSALAVLSRAKLFIGPEGGMHHGAAALKVPAVVLFGGFIPPEVTGYEMHANLAAGGPACGSLRPCHHCSAAMHSIKVEQVLDAVKALLR